MRYCNATAPACFMPKVHTMAIHITSQRAPVGRKTIAQRVFMCRCAVKEWAGLNG